MWMGVEISLHFLANDTTTLDGALLLWINDRKHI